MAKKRTDDYAIVVGINKYGQYPAYRPLEGAVADAQDFVDWLESDPGGNVAGVNIDRHYSDASGDLPRQDHIYESVARLLKRCCSRDDKIGRRIYIFLAGHGVSEELDSAALLAADHSEVKDSTVPAKKIADLFRQGAYFDEVVLFVDCCRSLVEDLTPPHMPFKGRRRRTAGQVRYCYGFAASPYGESFEKLFDKQVRGVFSWRLMKGLRGGAEEDHKVTAGSLARYVERHYGLQSQRPDFYPRHPDLVLAEGLAAPRTPVWVTLRDRTRGFQVRDGADIRRQLDPERKQIDESTWEIGLRPDHIYVIAVAHGRSWLEEAEVIRVGNERLDVEI